jgi:hypothetical protein
MYLGMRNRAVGSHAMNANSSRSHTVLSVRVRRELRADASVTCATHGKINFVDLAGSEMTKRTNSTGKTLEEANNINRSLMVLGENIQTYQSRFITLSRRWSQLLAPVSTYHCLLHRKPYI